MKTKVVALLCLVVFFLAGCSPAANGNVTSSSSARAEGGEYEGQPPLPETPQQTLERYIINTYKRNYETFYQVDSVSLTFVSENTNKNTYTATVLMKAVKTLKYKTVDELPFIKGALSALSLQSYPYLQEQNQKVELIKQKSKNLSASTLTNVVTYLDRTYDELTRYIGKKYDSYMFLYVTAPLTASNTLSENNLKVLVEQPQYQRIELKDFKPLSAQNMYDLGKQSMQRVINGTTIPLKKMYYDPWKVVEYADKYTSNATTVCPGTVIANDKTKWNNEQWPYYDFLCSTDCADFASQALNYAGLPVEPGKWQRLKDAANGWAWTSSSGLRRYLLQQKKIVRSVKSWEIRAGGLMMADQGHTMIVVRNDTIEILTNAHTNDRYHEPVLPQDNWYYLNSW